MGHFPPILMVALLVIFVSHQTYAVCGGLGANCLNDKHCCSKNCVHSWDWLWGKCEAAKSRASEVLSGTTCREDWDNHCTKHEQCCSANCWRGRPDWKFGVCKPVEESGGSDDGSATGVQPATSEAFSGRTCRRDWDNHCTRHQECCSTNCWRGRPDWRYGVCKPLEGANEESGGSDDGSVDGGSSNEEGSARRCRKNQDNHCTKHEQCCSNYCWRGRQDWKYGVCKPRQEIGEEIDGTTGGSDNGSVSGGSDGGSDGGSVSGGSDGGSDNGSVSGGSDNGSVDGGSENESVNGGSNDGSANGSSDNGSVNGGSDDGSVTSQPATNEEDLTTSKPLKPFED